MKFSHLGLDRYGRFTDRDLAFDPAARLVVILGANEAGKTTALNAACDVLFGIDERSRFNFLHDYKDMRLSATVTQDGRAFSFVRLKRRKAPLVDPENEAPLADDCLAPFLGAHGRAGFLDIFGLDQDRLRKGGRELLAGGGDLAETLIAAAPGLGHVAQMRDQFAGRAASAYKPGRKVAGNAFYRAADARAAARKQVRDLEVREDEVRALRKAAQEAAAARAAAVEAEGAAGQAAGWADLLWRAVDALRQIDADTAELASMGPLPQVPAGFPARTRAALAALEAAEAALARAAAEAARAAEAHGGVAVDGAILPLADLVAACDEERAAIEKARADLPRRREEAAQAGAGLARIAADLGLADGEALRARMPAAPVLARADALADRLKARALRAETLASDLQAHAREAAELEAARAGVGPVEDPEPLRRRLAALDGAEAREQALATAFARLKTARAALGERMLRLGLSGMDADGLAVAPFPALAAAEALLRAVNEAADARARLEEARAGLAEQKALAQARRATLDGDGTAPTEAAVAAARAARDALWQQLRPVVLAERAPQDADRQAAVQLDGALARADHVADERQRESRRLAELAQAEREIADLDVRLATLATRLAEAEARCTAAAQDWAALWAPAGMFQPADARAVAFLREVEAICAARAALVGDEAEGEAARAAVALDRRAAELLRRDLGLPPLDAAPLRMAELRDALARLEQRHQEARDRTRDLARLTQRRDELARRRGALDEESRQLAAEAADLLPQLAIRAMAPAEEVRAATGLWRSAATLSTTLATAEHRIGAILRDEAVFRTRVADLAGRAGEGEGEDAAATARRLRQRLEAAKAAQARADAAGAALAVRTAAVAQTQEDFARAQADVSAACQMAGDVPAPTLPGLLARLERAADCTARRDAAERRLADMARGRDLEAVRTAVAGADAATLEARAADAAAAHALARAGRDRAVERDAEARAALAALDTREGAARAAQDEQDALAAMAEAVEDFTRSHVASRLLARAIERYREQHQNPIVTRASQAFGALTLGQWSGIGIDYDQETPRLAALRDGTPHGIDHLSEGTADQLFLALRIAAIEEHARRAAPLPFMADDLFVSFDEARTEAGLKLLAELGALTQVIVFTHHAYVADAATRAVGEGCQVIRL
ncbi:AAA family ATPase [Xanthobacter sp. AM11]|uniref:AAA family ATPase n=1 Tax=Xanthobacter sp. AM11 TaxID=3380643 RepID=UPI0039BF12B0